MAKTHFSGPLLVRTDDDEDTVADAFTGLGGIFVGTVRFRQFTEAQSMWHFADEDGTLRYSLYISSDASGRKLAVFDVIENRDAFVIGQDGFIELLEFSGTSDAAAPSDNRARIYVRDNGAGKEQLVVRFATGAVQVLATEP